MTYAEYQQMAEKRDAHALAVYRSAMRLNWFTALELACLAVLVLGYLCACVE